MPQPAGMYFVAVEEGTPDEGNLVLVRLNDSTFRFGMVVEGHFAAYEWIGDQFVTMAHPDRITHWMRIIPPAVFSPAKAEAETAQPECLPSEDAGEGAPHAHSSRSEERPSAL